MARGGRPWRAWSALGVGMLLVASCSSGTEGGNDDAAPSTATGAGGHHQRQHELDLHVADGVLGEYLALDGHGHQAHGQEAQRRRDGRTMHDQEPAEPLGT